MFLPHSVSYSPQVDMVSVSLSYIYNHIRHAISNNTSNLSAIFLHIPRRLLVRRHKPIPKKQSLLVLYPRLLQKRQNNEILFDTLTAAQYLSASSTSSLHSRCDNPPPALVRRKNRSGLDMPVTPNYTAPRAPIVLCHGLYGFDKWGPDAFPMLQIHYWGGIEEALAKIGAKVIVTKVPRTGSVWERAQELHTILKAVLAGKDVNFIAHSMVSSADRTICACCLSL